MEGWKLYLSQPILPASIAYIMLYFNAVLGPGGLMTAFLASRGLSGTAAATFRCTSTVPPTSSIAGSQFHKEMEALCFHMHENGACI